MTNPTIPALRGEIQSITCLTCPWYSGLGNNWPFIIAPLPVVVKIDNSGRVENVCTLLIEGLGGITFSILPFSSMNFS